MINRAWSVYRDNRSTFYDFRTNRPHKVLSRNILFLIISAGLAFLIKNDASALLGAVITVQAILIGFSFSVMFFLVQAESKAEAKTYSLEEGLRREQVSLLSKELFWNVSYFNLTALSGLLIALALMVPNVWGAAAELAREFRGPTGAVPSLVWAERVTHYAAKFLFCLLLIESSFTFLRTVGRVNFLFEERMKLVE